LCQDLIVRDKKKKPGQNPTAGSTFSTGTYQTIPECRITNLETKLIKTRYAIIKLPGYLKSVPKAHTIIGYSRDYLHRRKH
jgi:hypothetical protein